MKRRIMANGFLRTDTMAIIWGIFGDWLLANLHVAESLANGFCRPDTFSNV